MRSRHQESDTPQYKQDELLTPGPRENKRTGHSTRVFLKLVMAAKRYGPQKHNKFTTKPWQREKVQASYGMASCAT